MLGLGTPEIILLLLALAVMFVPPIIVAKSDRVDGSTKALWVIIAFLLNWVGLIVFFVANKKVKE